MKVPDGGGVGERARIGVRRARRVVATNGHTHYAEQMALEETLPVAPAIEPPCKAPVDPASLVHAQLQGGPFWQRIPAYREIGEGDFLDHRWQAKNSITNIPKLLAALRGLVSEAFIKD